MTRIIIKEIIWDAYNTQHIRKHKIIIGEVKTTVENLAYHKKSYENRYLAVGRSNKRILTIVINRISEGKYYLVTARDASKNERNKLYEKEKKQNS